MMRWLLTGWVALMVGCGASSVGTARHVLEYSARAGSEVDDIVSAHYEERAEDALELSESLSDYQETMAPLDGAVRAVATLRESLFFAEYSLDAVTALGQQAWLTAASCLVSALVGVGSALESAGLDIPPLIATAISKLEPFAAMGCDR